MAEASAIHEHMQVVGAHGGHIGTVDRIEGGRIKLAKDDRGSGGAHHYLPLGFVAGVEGDIVRMSFEAELAPQFWETEGHERPIAASGEPGDGPDPAKASADDAVHESSRPHPASPPV